MANTYKGRMFINEPMDGKMVTDVPGIGECTATILQGNGIEEAEELYEVFLECACNKAKFQKWMKVNCNVIPKVSDLTYEAFNSWNKKFHLELYEQTDDEGDNTKDVPKPKRLNSESETGSPPRSDCDKMQDLKQQEYTGRADAVVTFFIAMAKKVALYPPNVQDQVEKQVYDAVMGAKPKLPSMEALYQPVTTVRSGKSSPAATKKVG